MNLLKKVLNVVNQLFCCPLKKHIQPLKQNEPLKKFKRYYVGTASNSITQRSVAILTNKTMELNKIKYVQFISITRVENINFTDKT